MPHALPPLPYERAALAPFISAETLEYHHGKHHKAYVDNLNKLLDGKPEANKTLVDVILASDGPVFNNAAQVWNHTFYWSCMKPKGGGEPGGKLAEAITASFGGFAGFREQFTKAAVTLFGSGWVWLALSGERKLVIEQAGNAGNPIREAVWITCRTDSTPFLCPAMRGRCRLLAQRPLPSMMMATCLGSWLGSSWL